MTIVAPHHTGGQSLPLPYLTLPYLALGVLIIALANNVRGSIDHEIPYATRIPC